jgi:predicted nucleic acid-binding protein
VGNRISSEPIPDPVLEWGLGAGEASVLGLALGTPGRMAVLDDAAARNCARSLGVPFLGTLAVILRSKEAGLIVSAAPVMLSLRQAGLRLDDRVLRETLSRINETWPG